MLVSMRGIVIKRIARDSLATEPSDGRIETTWNMPSI